MTREEYFRLRILPENKDLSDDEFFNKYKDKCEEEYKYIESNNINCFNKFKRSMKDIKKDINKRTVIL